MKEKLQEINALEQDRNSPNDKFFFVLKHPPCNQTSEHNALLKVKKSLKNPNSVDDIHTSSTKKLKKKFPKRTEKKDTSKVKEDFKNSGSVDDVCSVYVISGRERDSLEGSREISLKSSENIDMINGSHTTLHTPSTKKEDSRINIYLSSELHSMVKEYKINLSQFVRKKLMEHFSSKNIEIKTKTPDLILLVKCPFCSNHQTTTTIKTVRCSECNKQYRVMRRGKSRIVKIIKGDANLVHKLYYSVYPKRGAF